ncbi:MAG: asparagine synthase (glutamine-hydrolyzing) [Magnetococcus sp. WYHC-3]
MCGICGRFSWDPPPRREVVAAMARSLAHRGPDAEGLYVGEELVLGHRRLAVLDPGAAGNQPMADASGRFWIVFNGEIYNFRELRSELASLGHVFSTRTDTEVILEAYKRWGRRCLERFNGMFALALWDRGTRELFLARDRFGKKPFYYYPLPDGGVAFASELGALLQDPAVPRVVDAAALNHYLALNYTLTEAPIIAGVRKLPPAHWLLWRRQRAPEQQRYWDLAPHFHNKRPWRSLAEAGDAFNALLTQAVRRRLVSDVPLGAFLSGGVDSSTIVSAMAQQGNPGAVRTFSIGFAEQGYSELDQARRVAGFLGVDHNPRTIDASLIRQLPAIAACFDEPFADTSLLPMYSLAQFARQQVTVALSGDGADELFGGYTTYTADQVHRLVHWLPGTGVRLLRFVLDRVLPVTYDKVGWDYKLRQFLAGVPFPFPRAHYSWREIFNPTDRERLLQPDWHRPEADPAQCFARFFAPVRTCHFLDQAMYVDLNTWLVDDILVKVDRTTMAWGLEARAPFLDHELAEFAAALPVAYKIHALQRKVLIRHSQARHLPGAVLNRRKEGFNAPVSHWLGEARKTLTAADGTLDLAPGFLRPDAVERLWGEHFSRRRDHGLGLLGLIMFHLWWRRLNATPPVAG